MIPLPPSNPRMPEVVTLDDAEEEQLLRDDENQQHEQQFLSKEDEMLLQDEEHFSSSSSMENRLLQIAKRAMNVKDLGDVTGVNVLEDDTDTKIALHLSKTLTQALIKRKLGINYGNNIGFLLREQKRRLGRIESDSLEAADMNLEAESRKRIFEPQPGEAGGSSSAKKPKSSTKPETPLELMRLFMIRRNHIVNANNRIYFGNISYPAKILTNFKISLTDCFGSTADSDSSKVATYNLITVLLFAQRMHLPYEQYRQEVKALRSATVWQKDADDLKKYLLGEIQDCAKIIAITEDELKQLRREQKDPSKPSNPLEHLRAFIMKKGVPHYNHGRDTVHLGKESYPGSLLTHAKRSDKVYYSIKAFVVLHNMSKEGFKAYRKHCTDVGIQSIWKIHADGALAYLTGETDEWELLDHGVTHEQLNSPEVTSTQPKKPLNSDTGFKRGESSSATKEDGVIVADNADSQKNLSPLQLLRLYLMKGKPIVRRDGKFIFGPIQFQEDVFTNFRLCTSDLEPEAERFYTLQQLYDYSQYMDKSFSSYKKNAVGYKIWKRDAEEIKAYLTGKILSSDSILDRTFEELNPPSKEPARNSKTSGLKESGKVRLSFNNPFRPPADSPNPLAPPARKRATFMASSQAYADGVPPPERAQSQGQSGGPRTPRGYQVEGVEYPQGDGDQGSNQNSVQPGGMRLPRGYNNMGGVRYSQPVNSDFQGPPRQQQEGNFGPSGGPQGGGFGPQGGPQGGSFGSQGGPQGGNFGPQGGPQDGNFGPQSGPQQGNFGPQGGPQGDNFGPQGGPQGGNFGPRGGPQGGPQGGNFGPPGGPQGGNFGPPGGPQGDNFGPPGGPRGGNFGPPGGPQGGNFGPPGGPQGENFGPQRSNFGPGGGPQGGNFGPGGGPQGGNFGPGDGPGDNFGPPRGPGDNFGPPGGPQGGNFGPQEGNFGAQGRNFGPVPPPAGHMQTLNRSGPMPPPPAVNLSELPEVEMFSRRNSENPKMIVDYKHKKEAEREERLQRERDTFERLEKERIEKEKLELELKKKDEEAKRIREQLERELKEKIEEKRQQQLREKRQKEQLEKEKKEREKLERELQWKRQLEEEKQKLEQAERERLQQEQWEKEQRQKKEWVEQMNREEIEAEREKQESQAQFSAHSNTVSWINSGDPQGAAEQHRRSRSPSPGRARSHHSRDFSRDRSPSMVSGAFRPRDGEQGMRDRDFDCSRSERDSLHNQSWDGAGPRNNSLNFGLGQSQDFGGNDRMGDFGGGQNPGMNFGQGPNSSGDFDSGPRGNFGLGGNGGGNFSFQPRGDYPDMDVDPGKLEHEREMARRQQLQEEEAMMMNRNTGFDDVNW